MATVVGVALVCAVLATLPVAEARASTFPAAAQRAPAPPVRDDTVALLLRAARRAEASFERLARQRAPLTFASFGGRCDEVVGRFCLRYESSGLPAPAPEPPEVMHARREAIEALRRAFAYAPAEAAVTGPLVRFLVEDERAAEAIAAARAYVVLARDSTFGGLLLGFALHAAAEDSAAERWFEIGMSRLDAGERERILDVGWLLSNDEVRHYNRLDADGRRAYEAALWALSDPLYLTPGNARRAEHMARHVWSRIMAATPRVGEMVRWGRDLEQLTVRYGMPTSRVRARGTRPGESSMIERFDPDQLAYTVEDLVRSGVPPPPLPGESWPLDNPRARSGYAPVSLRRIAPLEHQVSRFRTRAGYVIRVDGSAPLDSAAAGSDSARIGLFLLDSLHQRVHGEVRTAPVRGDTVRMTFMAHVPAGRWVYSAEVLEPGTRYAARARYAVETGQDAGIALSDVVISEPFANSPLPSAHDDQHLRPMPVLVLEEGATIGVFAEVSGLAAGPDARAHYRVEVSRRTADRATLPAEIVRWLGRRLGLGASPAEPTASWTAEGPAMAVNAIAVDIPLHGAAPGLHVFAVTVTDLVTGTGATSRRVIRVR